MGLFRTLLRLLRGIVGDSSTPADDDEAEPASDDDEEEPAKEQTIPASPLTYTGNGDARILDVAIYSTRQTFDDGGRLAEHNAVRFLARALRRAGYNYNIEFEFDPVDRDFSAADVDAIRQWSSMKQEHRGDHLNLALHHKPHNGISFGGRATTMQRGGETVWSGRYGIAPAGDVQELAELVDEAESDTYRNIRAALHEAGHTLGGKHSDEMIPAPHLLYQNVEDGWMDSPPP